AFAAIGAIVLALLVLRLPDDAPRSEAKGQIVAYPAIGGAGAGVAREESVATPLRWRDPRVLPWHLIGVIGGHGHAVLLGVIGFLVIDRLGVSPGGGGDVGAAQQAVGIVMMAGAGAQLLAQWALIPHLGLGPKRLMIWGLAIGGAGAALTAFAETLHALTIGFAIVSLGMGLFRPGYTAGPSLAVEEEEQGAVAGMVTSVNGFAFIAAPAAGVLIYGLWAPLPFLIVAGVFAALAAWIWLRVDNVT
ncbi:MAG: MFS transporter, partial [Sphingomonadaceae bacterium]|nr:MFS transporter [Sphingomonadaceae bacterium]